MTGDEGLGTAAELHAAATALTGLADFGADGYRDGLAVLLESCARDAGLTPKGIRVARAMIRGALTARLFSEAGWARHPEHAGVDIDQPIFVIGLPRTGTTALHRLLTADPAHQGLQAWLAEVPQPRPPRQTWATDPVFQAIQAGFDRHHVSHPEFMAVHYLAADQVEECWQLLRQSMRSIAFECLAHLPGYATWLRGQDWTGAYRRHRRNLQLIGLPDRDRRWVLKNPSHLFALDALLRVYPDALVIQTHRDSPDSDRLGVQPGGPGDGGLVHHIPRRGDRPGPAGNLGGGPDGFTEARARQDPARFYDVEYDDFVANPLDTVAAVYGHFGLALTGRPRTPCACCVSRALGPAGRAHHYALADFGLTTAQVDERFAGYFRARG